MFIIQICRSESKLIKWTTMFSQLIKSKGCYISTFKNQIIFILARLNTIFDNIQDNEASF